MSVTETLAAFIAETSFFDISPLALTKAKSAILDCLGVTLAGAAHSASQSVLQYIEDVESSAQVTLIGHQRKASTVDAAFANGFFGHVLDFDDTNLSFVGHPTVAILPAILAIAERTHASGKDLITAYVIGTEVQWRIGDALVASGNHYSKGWHSTCTVGSFGAAAASARLLKLDERATAHALGIVASEAAGFREQFGTHCKPFHAGRANQNGVTAAMLARHGFTSALNALEGKLGFIRLVADTYADIEVKKPGDEWSIADPTFARGLFLKKHPVCGSGFGAIEGIQELMARHSIDPDDIAEILCGTDPEDVAGLKYHKPTTALEAKFSLEAWIAITLIKGRLGLPQLTDSIVQDPKVQDLMRKVSVFVDPNIQISSCRVNTEIRFRSGQTLRNEYFPMKGAPNNALTDDELLEKFMDCAALSTIPTKNAIRVASMVRNLESLEDASLLVAEMGMS